jgi:ribosomal protein L20
MTLTTETKTETEKAHKFGFRATPLWLARITIAARLADMDASELARLAVNEKIDRLKVEKPGFATALAQRLKERFPELAETTVDLQSDL